MRAYLIDPVEKTVTEVEHTGDYKAIQQATHCRCIDLVRLSDGDGVYVDDEGLFNPQYGFFVLTADDGGMQIPLAGYGLVLGSTPDGESADAAIELSHLQQMVSFHTHAEVMQLAHENKFG